MITSKIKQKQTKTQNTLSVRFHFRKSMDEKEKVLKEFQASTFPIISF